jgi:hypothetical protein
MTRTFAAAFATVVSRIAHTSRPGEFRPEPPTDPDVNLSIHPARATQRRLPPSIKTRSSSGCPLTPPDVGDLLPLLHGHYPVSSLLRSSAPLVGASVLSASWGVHLCLFPLHHRPGSQVPYESPDKSHAACTPDPAWTVSRYLPCCSQDTGETLVLVSSKSFRRFLSGSFALISLIHT